MHEYICVHCGGKCYTSSPPAMLKNLACPYCGKDFHNDMTENDRIEKETEQEIEIEDEST